MTENLRSQPGLDMRDTVQVKGKRQKRVLMTLTHAKGEPEFKCGKQFLRGMKIPPSCSTVENPVRLSAVPPVMVCASIHLCMVKSAWPFLQPTTHLQWPFLTIEWLRAEHRKRVLNAQHTPRVTHRACDFWPVSLERQRKRSTHSTLFTKLPHHQGQKRSLEPRSSPN